MATENTDRNLVWLGMREIRDAGGAIGQSWDIEALRELGLADDNGDLIVEGAVAKTAIYDDGIIEIDLTEALEQADETQAAGD